MSDLNQRANEILNDKYLKPLLYLIGRENGITEDKVNRDYRKKYFKEMVITYMKGEVK